MAVLIIFSMATTFIENLFWFYFAKKYREDITSFKTFWELEMKTDIALFYFNQNLQKHQ